MFPERGIRLIRCWLPMAFRWQFEVPDSLYAYSVSCGTFVLGVWIIFPSVGQCCLYVVAFWGSMAIEVLLPRWGPGVWGHLPIASSPDMCVAPGVSLR